MNTNRFEFDEKIYTGRVLELHRVGVKMHDGKVMPHDLVHYGGAALIVPILPDGSIVMIKNYRFAVDETLWEIPAGMVDPGEDPDVCAGRELTEETGYVAGKLEKLGEFFLAPGSSDEVMHTYLAQDMVKGQQDLEVYEQITVEHVSQDEARRMIVDGRIHDSKTIAGLCMYWAKIGRM